VDVTRGEVAIEARELHLALAINEHARLAKRSAYVIAAALPRTLGQRQKDAVGRDIAGRVVAGGSRQEGWPIRTARRSAFVTEPGHGLGHLFPTAAMTEGAIVAVTADRRTNDAWPKRGHLPGRESELADRARSIALHEDVCRTD